MDAEDLARVGVTVFTMLFATALPTEHQGAGRALVATASPAHPSIAIAAISETDRPAAGAGFQELPSAVESAERDPDRLRGRHACDEPGQPHPGVPVRAGLPRQGNRTACGQLYSPQILGVAHPTLPCGTQLTLVYGRRAVTLPVIDRGPHTAGRTINLSNATKLALGCTDPCTLAIQVLR